MDDPALSVYPVASASRPESPFMSPQKKRDLLQRRRHRKQHQNRPSSNHVIPSTFSPDLDDSAADLAVAPPAHPSVLSRHHNQGAMLAK